MINYNNTLRNLATIVCNILLAYVVCTICRICFLAVNTSIFANIPFSHTLYLLRIGLIFDSPAILYANMLLIAMFLFPLHLKERSGYYQVARWIYVIINSVCAAINLGDGVYFPFSGKRTTFDVFDEFANEGGGQMAKIFTDQTLAHWPLVLVFVALVYILWKGFRAPSLKTKKAHKQTLGQYVSYYAAQLAALAVAVTLSVGLIRGGFGSAVRPITISNANQYVDNPQEAGVVLNTVFALIRTFDKAPLTVPEYMSPEEAEAIYTPVHIPDSTAKFRPMNVVVLIMESFGKQHIGFYNKLHDENGAEGDKETFTPFLDTLLEKSLTFRFSYANGRKSIEGMPSVLSSIPNFVTPFFLTPASMNNLSGLARELCENKGYTSSFSHGAENGSMGFEAFARSTGFQEYYGRTEYKADANYGGDKDFDGTWAIFDEEFMQFWCDRISESQTPFVASIFTATSHTPYTLPERYKDTFPKGKDPIQECIAYTDNALCLFFEKAQRQPWFENTLFVITADHGSGFLDRFYTSTTGYYSVPIIFYAPGMSELRGYDTRTIAEQIDIMPTALGILGYDQPYIAFGQDILHTTENEKFAIHWINGLDGYELMKGDYLIRYSGEELTDVYAFRTDLYQQENLLGTVPDSIIQPMDSLKKSIVQQYMQRMKDNNLIYTK